MKIIVTWEEQYWQLLFLPRHWSWEFSLTLIKARSEGNLASKTRSGCETNGLLWDMNIFIYTLLSAQEPVWPRPLSPLERSALQACGFVMPCTGAKWGQTDWADWHFLPMQFSYLFLLLSTWQHIYLPPTLLKSSKQGWDFSQADSA